MDRHRGKTTEILGEDSIIEPKKENSEEHPADTSVDLQPPES